MFVLVIKHFPELMREKSLRDIKEKASEDLQLHVLLAIEENPQT